MLNCVVEMLCHMQSLFFPTHLKLWNKLGSSDVWISISMEIIVVQAGMEPVSLHLCMCMYRYLFPNLCFQCLLHRWSMRTAGHGVRVALQVWQLTIPCFESWYLHTTTRREKEQKGDEDSRAQVQTNVNSMSLLTTALAIHFISYYDSTPPTFFGQRAIKKKLYVLSPEIFLLL